MNTYILKLAFVLILLYKSAYGQFITPFVINSTGGSFTNGQLNIGFNIGEVVVTSIGNTNIITQGLLQAEVKKAGVGVTSVNEQEFTLYPSPTNSSFQIKGLTLGINYTVIISDLSGKIIIQQTYTEGQSIDISFLSPSIYYITLFNQSNNIQLNLKLFKTL